MLTIDILKELLKKLYTRAEKIHDENGSNYIKGFIAGEIHMISFLIEENLTSKEDYKGCNDSCCNNLKGIK